MAAIGDIFSIAHVLKKAYALYEGCKAAPEEIQLAREHLHAMTLCLEGVQSDLINNTRSFVHQQTAIAKTRQHALKVHIGTCDGALKRMGKLLKTFIGLKGKHVSLWDKFRWSTEGKKEIANCKADLVLATSVLDLFLSKESLNVLWRLEAMMEVLTRRMALLEMFDLPTNVVGQKRPRAGSNVTRTIVVSLVLARLRKILIKHRRRKTSKNAERRPQPGPKRPKPATRVNSGFVNNKKRNEMLKDYASKVAGSKTPVPSNPPRKNRPRTPSPDFYYIPGGTKTSPIPRPIRRSSSMQRLMGRLNAKPVVYQQPTEHYGCWRIGVGNLAVGLKTPAQYVHHKRGQVQLKKMAAVFKEASMYDTKALTERDSRVKALLTQRNKDEAKKSGKGSEHKWYFVSGRVVGQNPGKTGMVTVEKAIVVLVRR